PDFPFLHEDVDLVQPEVHAAVEAIQQLSGAFVAADYTDRYREALEDLIEAKIEGREIVRPVAAKEDATVGDLITALRESGDAAMKSRNGKDSGDAAARARSAAGKAAAAKESAAKAAGKSKSKAPR